MTISAKVIAHSWYPGCPDLVTVQARYPRFIHAELMTHRVFSRNASSSRAVPIDRMIQDVLDDTAMPVAWGSNQPGMQAGAEIARKFEAIAMWLEARDRAVEAARDAQRLGLHKQIVNRLIEPFGHITVLITATEWENFFALRCHPAADPTMRELADAIDLAIRASKPTLTKHHLPYGGNAFHSAARCARVSYLNHDGTEPDEAKDEALASTLMDMKHWSPFEHQARPAPGERHANLNGWKSRRTTLEAL